MLPPHHLPLSPRPPLCCCSEEERGKLQRSMGLKMEQLKAEVAQLDTLHE